MEAMGQRTTAGIQYCVRFRQNQAIDSPSVVYIYVMPCPRRCETMESVLVWALHCIDNDRGYQSEIYTTDSGDMLGLRPVRIHVLLRFIRTVIFN